MGFVLWTADDDLGWKPPDVGRRERIAVGGPEDERVAVLASQWRVPRPDAGEGRALGGAFV